jgi:DNA repair exonuclease SbcCD nuclease subunit
MKALIFSDIHGHNFREFSYIMENGMNSRLYDQQIVFEKLKLFAIERNVDMVLFLGDLYHLKNNADSQVIKIISSGLMNLAQVAPVLIVPGNHDYRMWSSEPALLEIISELGEAITILEKGWYEDIFYVHPYTRRMKEAEEVIKNLEVPEGSIFLGHQDVKGVNYGGFVVEHGLDADVLSKKFKMSFIGHCHDAFIIRDNVISIGAPMQHNFNDIGQVRGWWLWDLESNKLEQHRNDFSPEFWDWYYGKDKLKDSIANLDRDFFRVTIEGTEIPDEVKKMKWKRITFKVESDRKERIAMNMSDSYEDIIQKYVEARGGEVLDHKKLMEIGRKFL